MTEPPVTMPLHMQRHQFDPVEDLGSLRDDGAVVKIDTGLGISGYLVTRYDDVRRVLSDPDRFSNADQRSFAFPDDRQSSPEELSLMLAGQLLALDPPEHTRLRHMLTPEFTGRRLRRLEPRIAEIVDQHLDAMERTGPPADLVAQFAMPIPSLVICELLGVPFEDHEDFQSRTQRQLDISLPTEERRALAYEGREYMARLVDRARSSPGEDMLGMLVREHGDELTTDELIGIASLLLIAGHETTANMLGLGTLALLRHPDQLALVREDPAMVGPAIEELLRWLSIVHSGIPRATTTEVELSGHTIPAGELVVCALPAANRDPALVEDPDRLDITRGAPRHLAFGHGIHHCLGAPLARLEMRIAFPALLRRFPRLALAVDADEVPFRSFEIVYGLQALPVTW